MIRSALFACAGFLQPFVPLPLRCSAQAIGFGFFGLCFCPGVLWLGVTGDHALLCMVFLLLFCCCIQFFFFSGSDDSRGQGEDTWIWSGSVAGLAGGSPGFFKPVRLACFGAFLRLFFLGVSFGLLLCPLFCLRLIRTRSLSAFCAGPRCCFAWLCSWLWVLSLWVGGLFLPVPVFLPAFVPPAP